MGTYSQDFSTGVDNLLTFDSVGYKIVAESQNGFSYNLKMRPTGNNGNTYFTLTLTVAANSAVSFWRKVSSESGCDFLRFYVDGVQKDAWSGVSVAWAQVSYALTAGTHTLKWAYTKDSSSVGGSQDTAWLTGIQVTEVTTDLTSMYTCPGYDNYYEDFEGSSMPTGWTGSWAPSTDWAYHGSKSAKSNAIGNSTTTSETYTFTAYSNGILDIHARTSCENGYDFLRLYINDIELDSLTGEPNTLNTKWVVKSGTHTFKASYIKDSSNAHASDAAYIDAITFPWAVVASAPVQQTKRRYAQII